MQGCGSCGSIPGRRNGIDVPPHALYERYEVRMIQDDFISGAASGAQQALIEFLLYPGAYPERLSRPQGISLNEEGMQS